MLRNWRLGTIIALVALLAFGGGAAAALWQQRRSDEQQRQKYSLLSRRILLEKRSDVLLNFRDLQDEYQQYLVANNLTDKVNLYFEYLPTGSSIGINEDRQSTGASLLKVPLVVSFYKLVEAGKLSLDTTVGLKPEWLNKSYGELYKKGAGYQLSYREAVRYALQYSDNTAALALFEAVSQQEGTKTPGILSFIDANYANTDKQEVTISVESYSSILKCLYFSCYLTKDDSQAMLSDMTQSVAKDRLVRYIPNDVRVAHKIGTFEGLNQSDCGIFYVPKRHYILCIMVQESDPTASRIIGDLSQMTYKNLKPPEVETK